jgi:hypothetical protein
VKYLASHGIDSKQIVIQRGARNYAGPHCPGRGWTCTTAKRVVQISYMQNIVQFTCTPSVGGSAVSPNSCLIVQSSTGAANNATCTEKVGDPIGGQTCSIYQLNTTGTNNATVTQQVSVMAGPTQSASQSTDIAQWNGSGSNWAYVSQDLKENQSALLAAAASLTQSQDGQQTTAVSQHSDSGNNNAQVNQSLALTASASGGTSISQLQDTDGSHYNTSAAIYQNDDQFPATGTNNATLSQSNALNASGGKTGSLTQTQGAFTSGIFGHISQFSSGLSTQSSTQNERQLLSAGGVPAGQLHQTQIGPLHWEPNQGSDAGDKMSISQTSTQNATPSAFQNDRADASCDTSGICTVTQTVTNSGGRGTNSCSAPSCNIGLTVAQTGSSEGTGVFPCVGSCTFPSHDPPPPPDICDQIFGAPPCTG